MFVENVLLYIGENTVFVHKELATEFTVLRTVVENNDLSVLSSSRNLLYHFIPIIYIYII